MTSDEIYERGYVMLPAVNLEKLKAENERLRMDVARKNALLFEVQQQVGNQIHSLTEALSDRKQQPKVEDVCESLQRLVVSEKVVISTAENNPKWRPLTLVMWDDAKHLKKEPEGKTR